MWHLKTILGPIEMKNFFRSWWMKKPCCSTSLNPKESMFRISTWVNIINTSCLLKLAFATLYHESCAAIIFLPLKLIGEGISSLFNNAFSHDSIFVLTIWTIHDIITDSILWDFNFLIPWALIEFGFCFRSFNRDVAIQTTPSWLTMAKISICIIWTLFVA